METLIKCEECGDTLTFVEDITGECTCGNIVVWLDSMYHCISVKDLELLSYTIHEPLSGREEPTDNKV